MYLRSGEPRPPPVPHGRWEFPALIAESAQNFLVDPESRDRAPDPAVPNAEPIPFLSAFREMHPVRVPRKKPEGPRDPRRPDLGANHGGTATAAPFLNRFDLSHRVSPVRVSALVRVYQLRDLRSILGTDPVDSGEIRRRRAEASAPRALEARRVRDGRDVRNGQTHRDIALFAARLRRGPTWRATRRRTRGTRSTPARSCAFPASSRTVALVPPGRTRPLNSSAR